MAAQLARRLGSRYTFVVGKGGVGKTTTAGALALAFADAGEATHLISVDPAHSLADLFGQPLAAGEAVPSACTSRLLLEEFDGPAYARAWSEDVGPAFAELVERGTYLEPEDARALFTLSLPGVDEVMAALRLVELAGSPAARIVVDAAPTGHLIRLLEADATLSSWASALDAMAAKAGAVAAALLRRSVRFEAEKAIDDLRTGARRFRHEVLAAADFVLVVRPDPAVLAESHRLRRVLAARGLGPAVELWAATDSAPPPALAAPAQPDLRGCDGLRRFVARESRATVAGERPAGSPPPGRAAPALAEGDAQPLVALEAKLVFFAGKGGVGKTTCSAAYACALSRRRPVSLFSVDPAGSLGDVLERDLPEPGVTVRDSLFVRQLDAAAELDRFRQRYREQVAGLFAAAGLDLGARLDHRVLDALWELAPPGMDELFALAEILDHTESDPDRTLVVDCAPTGHFLRLIRLPELALDWVHALMRTWLKYRQVMTLDDTGEALLRFARRLRRLQAGLSDPDFAAAVLVTMPEPMVLAESARLSAALREAGLAVCAVVVNRWTGRPCPPAGPGLGIAAPLVRPPPAGEAALQRFFDDWKRIE